MKTRLDIKRECPICNCTKISWAKTFYDGASPNPGHRLNKELVIFECGSKVMFNDKKSTIVIRCDT